MSAAEAQADLDAEQQRRAVEDYKRLLEENQRLRQQVVSLKSQNAELRGQIDDLNERLHKALVVLPPATRPSELSSHDPIATALSNNTLAVGMTLEQANQAMGEVGLLVGQDGPLDDYQWMGMTGYITATRGFDGYVATIENNKVASFRRIVRDPPQEAPQRPAPRVGALEVR